MRNLPHAGVTASALCTDAVIGIINMSGTDVVSFSHEGSKHCPCFRHFYCTKLEAPSRVPLPSYRKGGVVGVAEGRTCKMCV